MCVPSCLIWALECDRSSFVTVRSSSSPIQSVGDAFCAEMQKAWDAAQKQVVERFVPDESDDGYFEYVDASQIFDVEMKDDRFIVRFEPLYISYCYGEFCDVESACNAVDKAFMELVKLYPDVTYDGIIAFPWSDRRCGDSECYRICSENTTDITDVYPELAEIIDDSVSDDLEDEFNVAVKTSEELANGEDEDEYAEFIKFLTQYRSLLKPATVEAFTGAIRNSYEEIDSDVSKAVEQMLVDAGL